MRAAFRNVSVFICWFFSRAVPLLARTFWDLAVWFFALVRSHKAALWAFGCYVGVLLVPPSSDFYWVSRAALAYFLATLVVQTAHEYLGFVPKGMDDIVIDFRNNLDWHLERLREKMGMEPQSDEPDIARFRQPRRDDDDSRQQTLCRLTDAAIDACGRDQSHGVVAQPTEPGRLPRRPDLG